MNLDLWLVKLKLKFFHIPKPNLLFVFLLSFLIFVYSLSLLTDVIFQSLPSPTELLTKSFPATTKIYDRNGNLLYKIYENENRTFISSGDIPLSAILATLAIEDADFYTHPGFSIKGIARSVFKNLQDGKVTGGSTITQQLVKNTLLSPEKTLLRKVREIILAIKVELTFTKEEILTMYLNVVSYGNAAYGIEEASKIYFNKSAKNLTLSESAFLAGLPKSPTYFSPFGQNPDSHKARQKEVLHRMVSSGFITEDEADKAYKEKLVFSGASIPLNAPHFVMWIKQKLIEIYGEDVVEKGGLEVTTTLDLSIQNMAQSAVKEELDKLKSVNVTNASVLVLHPSTGEILAMVGSYDYFNIAKEGNVNVSLQPRSPGSSIKVVTYAYALSHGMTPASIISDTPISIHLPGQPPYIPKNYDGGFRGNLSLRNALAQSRNIPAVRTIQAMGVKNILNLGRDMGITTWGDTNRFGPSLTLGGGEVKLIDLAQVYATIANYGSRPNLLYFTKITDQKGKVLLNESCSLFSTNSCTNQKVLDERVAFMLIDILKDNFARSPAFGLLSSLFIPSHPEIAVKTGTSNDMRDNLTIGFNQKYLVAVWVGNNDNSPMWRIASGITGAAPIWNKIMSSLLSSEKSEGWTIPKGLVKKPVCTKPEWFLEENQSNPACPKPLPSPTPKTL